MSDKLYPLALTKLLNQILLEEQNGKIFGFYKDRFFIPKSSDPFKIKRYGRLISTPLGVAAGPHTQMSQNIITSWLFGARYIELKTVQVLDNLDVKKPCIEMYDEGYNCEWSQELLIRQSLDEYVNAWIIIHILKDKFGWDDDLIFNMSVGYNLEGIKSEKVQWFIDTMSDASELIIDKVKTINKLYPQINDLYIPSQISNNVTLSTMHGCPPAEIENIGTYLLKEKHLHTTIKLNPTLLGPDELRSILNTKLGYEIDIPDEAFGHDLKYFDSINIIRKLNDLAKHLNLSFGVKLTNTLESLNNSASLPKEEKMIYMSGRALHPISINLAAKLQKEFKGTLAISFSGGVDAFNFHKVVKCGISPITVCSDLLKPGGYLRLPQYLSELKNEMKNFNSITDFINSDNDDINNACILNLLSYANDVLNDERYSKHFQKYSSIKTKRNLTKHDCIQAPCIESCAIHQQIPNYLYHTSQNEFDKAYKSIINENPLPNITGMVCDHLCQTKCTRMNLDNSIAIREIKRFIAAKESNNYKSFTRNDIGKSVAIIGAGPAGLSAAYFLAIEGFDVTVYDSQNKAGGMASNAIPNFRIDRNLMQQDIINVESLGVKFFFNHHIDNNLFNELKEKHDYVFIAAGAQKGKKLNIEGEDMEGVLDQLTFLCRTIENKPINIGQNIAIIGGGNSAIDAARTARRLSNNRNVTLIYRRTINEMPADKEEIHEMLKEGVVILELVQPEKISGFNSKLLLHCFKMQLGDADQSGRRSPHKILNSEFTLEFDTIITAIGQDVVHDFLDENFSVKDNYQTSIENVFAGGDFIRGADSLINAIADGKNVANLIFSKINLPTINIENKNNPYLFQKNISNRRFGKPLIQTDVEFRNDFQLVNPLISENHAIEEAARCLFCDEICSICVTVCPNLSNISFEATPGSISYPVFSFSDRKVTDINFESFIVKQKYQIINIKDFCNECGNCNTFCPTNGAPYKTKPKFCFSKEAFEHEDNVYHFNDDELLFKSSNKLFSLNQVSGVWIFSNDDIEFRFIGDFEIHEIYAKSDISLYNSKQAAEMLFLYKSLKHLPIFTSNVEV